MESMTDPIEQVTYLPIGIIHTPFVSVDGMPIQPTAALGIRGSIVLGEQFGAGLRDLDGFSHLTLIYHLHEVRRAQLTVVPFPDDTPHGVFATRSPARPNPIGLSTVRLLEIRGCTLEIEDVDMLDGTPLLDIKPYVPAFDERQDVRLGWFADRLGRISEIRSDRRFSEP